MSKRMEPSFSSSFRSDVLRPKYPVWFYWQRILTISGYLHSTIYVARNPHFKVICFWRQILVRIILFKRYISPTEVFQRCLFFYRWPHLKLLNVPVGKPECTVRREILHFRRTFVTPFWNYPLCFSFWKIQNLKRFHSLYPPPPDNF